MIIFDNCPICWCNLEAMDAQRTECPGCSTITEAESKERVSDKIKLKSKNLKQYQNSPGYKGSVHSSRGGRGFRNADGC